jgi:hypothetical protein
LRNHLQTLRYQKDYPVVLFVSTFYGKVSTFRSSVFYSRNQRIEKLVRVNFILYREKRQVFTGIKFVPHRVSTLFTQSFCEVMLLVFIFLKQQQIVLPAAPLCLLGLTTQTAKTTVLIDDFKLALFSSRITPQTTPLSIKLLLTS